MRGRLARIQALVMFALVCVPAALLTTQGAGAQGGPKRPPITGVASFAVNVADMATARAFYSGVLGLDEAFPIKNPTGGTDLTTFKINDRRYVYVAPDLKDPDAGRLLFVGFETTDAKELRTVFRQ